MGIIFFTKNKWFHTMGVDIIKGTFDKNKLNVFIYTNEMDTSIFVIWCIVCMYTNII